MPEYKDFIKSNLSKLDAMTDDDIDYSDIPDLGDAEELWARGWVQRAGEPFFPVIPIDPEVLEWFSSQSEDYPQLINSILRSYIKARKNFLKHEQA
jgi:uncharacterized protein (DUF4415 family)